MSLYVHEAGAPDAPMVVFLHGLGLSGAMWQPQMERLMDFHCLAPDLPEHGKSKDEGLITLDNTSRLVANLIRERTPDGRTHVVGLSMGGAIAVRMLRNTPEVIDHAIVSGASTRLSPMLAALNNLNEPVLRWLGPDRSANLMLKQFNIPDQYKSLLPDDTAEVRPEAITRFSNELTRIEVPADVHGVPTLIAVGQKETFFAKHAAREMCKTIIGAKGVMVPGVGHAWSLEAPDLFADMVRAWISDVPLPQSLMALWSTSC